MKKSKWIIATIECTTKKDEVSEEIAKLQGSNDNVEWRPCRIKRKTINLYYPSLNGEHTCVDVEDGFFLLKESFEEFEKLMLEHKKTVKCQQ